MKNNDPRRTQKKQPIFVTIQITLVEGDLMIPCSSFYTLNLVVFS